MLLDYAVLLAGAYALLRLAHRWRGAAGPPPPAAVVLFTASVGLGSMAFFLGSRAYVYHEAILCGLACAVVATYAALRYWENPTSRWWLAALVAGVLAVHARPPIGLFALSVLGVAALGRLPLAPRRHLAVAVAAGLGVLSFNALSYLKFRTFEGCPLHLNVQYTPQSLAVLENKNFHLSNLRFNTDAYLLRPSFAVDGTFPYLYRTYIDRRRYPESRMAYRDQTLAMPWAMPGLVALVLLGGLVALRFVPAHRPPLVLLALAAAPAALAMLTAVAVTQRYEADFCPFLFAVAAFGAASLPAVPGALRRVLVAFLAAFSLLGVLVVFALTIHHQREIVWGVPEELRAAYRTFRQPASTAPR
jgi:FtsH-binding integral membrane protein